MHRRGRRGYERRRADKHDPADHRRVQPNQPHSYRTMPEAEKDCSSVSPRPVYVVHLFSEGEYGCHSRVEGTGSYARCTFFPLLIFVGSNRQIDNLLHLLENGIAMEQPHESDEDVGDTNDHHKHARSEVDQLEHAHQEEEE